MIGSVDGMIGCMPSLQKWLQSGIELTVLLTWRLLWNVYLRVKNLPLKKKKKESSPDEACLDLQEDEDDSRYSEQGTGEEIPSASFLPPSAAWMH